MDIFIYLYIDKMMMTDDDNIVRRMTKSFFNIQCEYSKSNIYIFSVEGNIPLEEDVNFEK